MRGWYAHTCFNYRANNDLDRYVRKIVPGNVIEFRAGFNIFDSKVGLNTINADTNYNDKKSFTIVDNSALALAASSLASVVAISHLSF